MQTVSQSWITAQEQTLVPESFVDITLRTGDEDAQRMATGYASTVGPASNVITITKEKAPLPPRYAFFELNMIDLSQQYIPYDSTESEREKFAGYVSNDLSFEDGTCDEVFSLKFPETITSLSPGITIVWSSVYGEWAVDFEIMPFNNGVPSGQPMMVTGNKSLISVVEMDLQRYKEIKITVTKWATPYSRVRCEQVFIGVELNYGKADIINSSHEIFIDPLSAELPKSEIVFGILNLNGKYNPDNPEGLEKYLTERQRIVAKYGYKLNGNIEWIPAGTFYLSEWDTPQNGITATFTARDGIEYMSDSYSGRNSGTLMSIATDAFTQSDLPLDPDGNNRWVIDDSLSSITAPSGLNLSQYTNAEVLQYCANAACCVFYQDRQGVFHIEPLQEGTTNYTIGPFVSYKNSESSLTKQLKAVDINDGAYVLTVGTIGETQTVKNPLISAARMPAVAQWIADFLQNRNLIEGEFRADPRLDALDRVTNTNKFATKTALITDITYTYNGAFRGQYKGRVGV